MGRLGLLLVIGLIITVSYTMVNISDIILDNTEMNAEYTYTSEDRYSAEEVIDKLIRIYLQTETHDTTITFGNRLGEVISLADANLADQDTLILRGSSYINIGEVDTQVVAAVAIVSGGNIYDFSLTPPLAFYTAGSDINASVILAAIAGKDLPGVSLPDSTNAAGFVADLDKFDKITGYDDGSFYDPDYCISINQSHDYYDILDLVENVLIPNADVVIDSGDSFAKADLFTGGINIIEGNLTNDRLEDTWTGEGICVVKGYIDLDADNVNYKGMLISILPEDATGEIPMQVGSTCSVSGCFIVATPPAADMDINLSGAYHNTYFKNDMADVQKVITAAAAASGASGNAKIVSINYFDMQ